MPQEPSGYTDEELERIDRAYTIWEEAGDPRGTDAAAYLASRSLLSLTTTFVERRCASTTIVRGAMRTPARRLEYPCLACGLPFDC